MTNENVHYNSMVLAHQPSLCTCKFKTLCITIKDLLTLQHCLSLNSDITHVLFLVMNALSICREKQMQKGILPSSIYTV